MGFLSAMEDEYMKLQGENIVISISEAIQELSKENIQQLFEIGLIEGCFGELIDDLLAGEIFGESYMTKYEVKNGGLTIDVLNELRKKITREIQGLTKCSFDFEHDLYVKSQKEVEEVKNENDNLRSEIRCKDNRIISLEHESKTNSEKE